MTSVWVAADHHFGSGPRLLGWRRGPNGQPFESIEAHDSFIIRQHNSVVGPKDTVYLLGDFAISKKAIRYATQMNGRITLIAGNHDIYNTSEYLKWGFNNVRGVRVFPNSKIVLSHVPLHSFKPGWVNYHGHLHDNILDGSYQNVCLEQLEEWKPMKLF